MANISLTVQDILKKEFKSKVRGYDAAEVDTFLDQIIADYKMFQQKLDELNYENERLRNQVDEKSKQISAINNNQGSFSSSKSDNIDILKRISNLERHVFGSQNSENDNLDNHRI